VSLQDLTALISAVFFAGMIWLRTRMHYVQQRRGGRLHLTGGGRVYFAAALLALAAGWFAATALLRMIWPAALVSPTLARVVWFLATYYLFIAVHRAVQLNGGSVFRGEETAPSGAASHRM